MGVRATLIPGHLRRARMATTPLTLTHARLTVTMDLAGFRAECLLALGPGGAGVGTTSMGDVALAGAATMEAAGPFPDAEGIAVGSVTVTPVEADVASVVADVPSMAVDVASVAAEAEAVPMVVGADRLRHISKLSRPTACAVGRFVARHRLGLLERFWGRKAPFLWESNEVI